MTHPDEYISVHEAARLLDRSESQVHRYAKEDNWRVQKSGKRNLFHRDDVEAKRRQLQQQDQYQPPVKTEMLAPSEFLDYIQQQEAKMLEMAHQIGQLKAENAMLKAHQQQERLLIDSKRERRVSQWMRRLLGRED